MKQVCKARDYFDSQVAGLATVSTVAIRKITIIFHPSLVDTIDCLPPNTRKT